jgi:hypothetical protein
LERQFFRRKERKGRKEREWAGAAASIARNSFFLDIVIDSTVVVCQSRDIDRHCWFPTKYLRPLRFLRPLRLNSASAQNGDCVKLTLRLIWNRSVLIWLSAAFVIRIF